MGSFGGNIEVDTSSGLLKRERESEGNCDRTTTVQPRDQ